MPFFRLICLLFCITILHGSISCLINQPQDAGPDVPAGKLRSLSFAPYHAGFSPIKQRFPLPEHVQGDVQVLADKTFAIRTYSVRGGMQPTPAFARQYAVDMMMGGWLGDGHTENRLEMATLIQAAQQNADVVKRVIVGNEVLLRKDMDINTLITYIRQVKQAVPQPVTYADVWSSYMQYPQLFKEVDFITIHILPYWEDEPVAIEQAAEHVETIVKQIEEKARSMGVRKPILIGESGWPALGRQRGAAVPGVINQARYTRDLIQVANRHGFDYNIVEAFNQPWKSNSEGVVGANWGLLDIDRQPVFPLTGPVAEDPDWQIQLTWSIGIGLLIVAACLKPLLNLTWRKQLLFLILAQLLGLCLVRLTDLLWQTSYSSWQEAYAVSVVALNAALVILLCKQFLSLLSGLPTKNAWTLTNVYRLLLLLAIYHSYHLAIDGRYLSFPTVQFAIPVLGILGGILCLLTHTKKLQRQDFTLSSLTGCQRQVWEGYLGYLLGFGTLAIVAGETHSFMSAYDFIQAHPTFAEGLPVALGYTLVNGQLLTWLVCSLLLAIPFCINPTPLAQGRRQREIAARHMQTP